MAQHWTGGIEFDRALKCAFLSTPDYGCVKIDSNT